MANVISERLQRKIDYSIQVMQKAEALALKYQDSGFHLAFSGGKDSQVIYHLAQMAGVKFTAHMQMTSVDPPQLLKFIRQHYPDVTLHPPRESIYKLIIREKCLPLRQTRYCCKVLKEHAGIGAVTIIGIRAQESSRRKKRKELTKGKLEVHINPPKNVHLSLFEKPIIDQFSIEQELLSTCVNGEDKIILSPILNWTYHDVWEFIRAFKLPYCELYNMGFHRIGCVFCPMASKSEKQRERELFPGIEKAYKTAIKYLVDNYNYGNDLDNDIDEIFNWWVSNDSVADYRGKKQQIKLKL